MKQKPLTLIEGSSESINDNFYDKVNKIIEEERRKNASARMPQSEKLDSKKGTVQCTS